MSEQPAEQALGAAQWQNVNNELVKDPVQAAHEAHVEKAWREKAEDLGKMAIESYDEQMGYGKPEDAESAQRGYLRGHDEALQDIGPKAQEEVAQAYQTLNNPHMPTAQRNELNH